MNERVRRALLEALAEGLRRKHPDAIVEIVPREKLDAPDAHEYLDREGAPE